MHFFRVSTMVAVAAGALAGSPAQAQAPIGGSPAQRPAANYEGNSGYTTPALAFFGRPLGSAYRQATASQPIPLPPQPIQMARPTKPFSGLQQSGGISPYLALDSRETSDSLATYYLLVRPQLEQQAYNQVQQAQFQRLQRQARTASVGGAIVAGPGGIPTTGQSNQFMNNGGYYPQLRR